MINNVKIIDQGNYLCGITNEWNKTKYLNVQLTVVGKIYIANDIRCDTLCGRIKGKSSATNVMLHSLLTSLRYEMEL